MTGDRQLWGLGGLSALATVIVLLGASGAGADISRAAAAAFGRAPTPPATQTVTDRTPSADASTGDASASDAGGLDAPAGTAGTADAAATDESAVATDDSSGDAAATDAPVATTASARTPSNIKHVFVVTLAGHGIDATFGSGSPAPYLATELRPKGVLLAGFTSLGRSGLADRIALVSGQPPNPSTSAGCPTFTLIPPLTQPDDDGVISNDGCVYPNTIQTLAEQLPARRLTWKAYAEDHDRGPKGGAARCRRPEYDRPDDTKDPRPGDTYAAGNVPWVYFRGLIDLASCDSGVVPLTTLEGDLGRLATTPNITYVAPGLCSDGSRPACGDGEPGGLAAADAFLRRVIPPLLASPAYQQGGLVIITFAGGPDDRPSKNGTLLLSKYLQAGGTVDTAYDPYSVLRTIEDLFALPTYLAKARTATSFAGDVLAAARPVGPGDD